MNPLSGSVFFSQAITYAPYTNSAVYALISGTYGNRNGCNSYWHSYQFKNKQFKTLTEYLHEDNFYTCADIHSDLIMPKYGFDEYLVFDESKVNLVERHKKLLENMKEKNRFFLYLHYSKIHTNIMNSVLKPYNNFSEEYFKNKKKNSDKYDLFFKESENYLEQIIKYIKELDLVKNTIIVVFSDHGISVGEKIGERAYGAFCYDYTLRTFAYFLYPNVFPMEINQQVRTIDFMPTILDYLKIKPDSNYELMDGQSLFPLVNGDNIKEIPAFSESGNPLQSKEPPEEPNISSIRTSKWKLIFNEYNNTKELYNLKNDSEEKINLAGNNLEIENVLWNQLEAIRLKI